MALKSLHAKITRMVLKKFGFSDAMCEKAAKANIKVDDNQGNRPQDAHLHAMLGAVTDRWGKRVPEDRKQGIAAITALIENARKEILSDIKRLSALVPGKTKQAEAEMVLEKIGRILHTVQDREFHNYGVWEHDGMCSALMSDALGLVLHGVHDTGFSYASLTGGSNATGRWGIETTFGMALSKQHDVHLYASYTRSAGGGLPDNNTYIGGLCFGACGSTRPTRSSYSPPGPIGSGRMAFEGIQTKGQASSGPIDNVLGRAEKATQGFVEDLRQQANLSQNRIWQEFVDATGFI